ncbi:hypothetical protein IEQ34_017392 [Dendrobium chrysotoxum]|uniref:Uncharacterized protein n=1 Tax=Dendrobium chrysotoxum TaxID=161865 RepID=A0AAV7GBC5_DENCH|nr:hypothetical protein IEQ34_017392 [Dendrobium chrysotoxum]
MAAGSSRQATVAVPPIHFFEETELDQPLVLIWQSAFARFSELFNGGRLYFCEGKKKKNKLNDLLEVELLRFVKLP